VSDQNVLRVDTAHGGNGQSLADAAPHLFSPDVLPDPFEHLEHAVVFEHPELAAAALHDPGRPSAVADVAPMQADLPEDDVTVIEDDDDDDQPVLISATTTEFEPEAYTVADVLAYMAENPAEAEAVRAAEVIGKGRKSIVGS
jgi:hypothetical protein